MYFEVGLDEKVADREHVLFTESSQKECDKIIKVIFSQVGARRRLFSYAVTRFVLHSLVFSPLKKVYGTRGASYALLSIGYSEQDREWVLEMCGNSDSKIIEWQELLIPRVMKVCKVFRDARAQGRLLVAVTEIEAAIKMKGKKIYKQG